MFKLAPPVVFKRSWQSEVELNIILDIPTFTTSRLPRDPSSQRWNYVGEKWTINFAWNARLPRNIQESFTCRKFTTWDRRLYFHSEGRRAEDFFALKNPTASDWFEPANLGTKGQHATSRPPKPLWAHGLIFIIFHFCAWLIKHEFVLRNFLTYFWKKILETAFNVMNPIRIF